MIIKKERGFTLIEILIVVAIIAILASIVIVGLGPAQQSGRDARRISDLQSIRTALQLYYGKCGFYPGGAISGGACPTSWVNVDFVTMSSEIAGTANNFGVSVIPDDPTVGKHYYYSSFSGGTTYTLGTQLENPNNSAISGNYNISAPADTNAPSGIPGSTCQATAAQPNYCISL
jgi:prepilin-type N-terminal cleavage/methylation domain-containing protein